MKTAFAPDGLQILTKYPGESRLYEFNFAHDLPGDLELIDVIGVTVTSAGVVNGSALVTTGAPTVEGKSAFVRIGGGTASERYKLGIGVQDSEGNLLEGAGWLYVEAL